MEIGKKKPNTILRHQRLLRGWSQQKLAQIVGTSEDVVSRWERGERTPSPFFQEKFCALYEKSAVELGFIASTIHQQELFRPEIRTEMNDRLDHAESIVNLSWETWFASRPKQASREMHKLLPLLEKIMHTAPRSLDKLHAKELAIRTHGLLGAISLDKLHNEAALRHYQQAYMLADEIQNTNLGATYLALMGDVWRRQNEKRRAISFMESAEMMAQHVDRATRGHILQLLAYTYADTGDEASFERTIAEAIDLLSFTGEGRDSTRKEFIPFEVYEIRGKASRDLGKPLQAIPYLELAEKALDKSDSIVPRWQALLKISRGQAYCDAGDLATGIELARQGFMLAYQSHSPRQMNRVRKLLTKLEMSPWAKDPRVKELREIVSEIYLCQES